MTSTNITLINISQQNIQGRCDLKCEYNFKYTTSNSIATNLNNYIQISYEQSGVPPVTYNNIKYNVDYILIIQPSIHNFNGTPAVAELIIYHTSLKGGGRLVVCIPFTVSGDNTTASNIISEIISLVASNAPNSGENVNLNSSEFTLQNIVPNKPFYNYTKIIDGTNYIIFDIKNAIPISSTTLNSLTTILQPIPVSDSLIMSKSGKGKENINIFYNAKGPNSNNKEDDIYISCNPTGNSENEETVTFQTTQNETVNLNFSEITSSPYFVYVMYALVFIIILMIINGLIGAFTSSSLKMPSFMKKNSSNSNSNGT